MRTRQRRFLLPRHRFSTRRRVPESRLTRSAFRAANFGIRPLVDGCVWLALAEVCGTAGTKPDPAADHREQAQLAGTLKVFGMIRPNGPYRKASRPDHSHRRRRHAPGERRDLHVWELAPNGGLISAGRRRTRQHRGSEWRSPRPGVPFALAVKQRLRRPCSSYHGAIHVHLEDVRPECCVLGSVDRRIDRPEASPEWRVQFWVNPSQRVPAVQIRTLLQHRASPARIPRSFRWGHPVRRTRLDCTSNGESLARR